MQIVVQHDGQILPHDALPFALSPSEIGFILFHVVDEILADVFFHEAFGVFLLFADELS